MRKPVLAGVCFGLLLLVTSTRSLENVPNSEDLEEDGGWLSSAGNLLHRVKRQFGWFNLGTRTTTVSPTVTTTQAPRFGLFGGFFDRREDKTTKPPPTPDNDEEGRRFTRSTVRDGVTPSLPSDDEDLGQQSGSGVESGESTWEPDNRKPRYYRILLVLTEPYNPEFETTGSPSFRFLSESLTKAISHLFEDIPGDQQSRVIKIQKDVDSFKIRVFLDLSSTGNHNTDQIRNLLQRQIGQLRRIGQYVVENEMIFNEFGVCESGQIQCKDNAGCVDQNSRCNGKIDCADESDEEGCPVLLTTTSIPTVPDDRENIVSGHTDHGSEDERSGVSISEDGSHGESVETSTRTDEYYHTGDRDRFDDRQEEDKDSGLYDEDRDRPIPVDPHPDKIYRYGETGERDSRDRVAGTPGFGENRDHDEERNRYSVGTDRDEDRERDRYDEDRDRDRDDDRDRDRDEGRDHYDEDRDRDRDEDRDRDRDEDRDRYDEDRDRDRNEDRDKDRHEDRDRYDEDRDRDRNEDRDKDRHEDRDRYDEDRDEGRSFYDGEERGRFDDRNGAEGRTRYDIADRDHEGDVERPIISTTYGLSGTGSPEGAHSHGAGEGRDNCRADDKVRCSSDNSIYICYDQECDGHPDCPGGSDELNCTVSKECATDEFMCDMTRCILLSQRCDGNKDCDDKTDEDDCPKPGCDFKCKDGTCLSYPQRCNIVKDCPDGDDELGCQCSYDDFTCFSGQCIHKKYHCDGEVHCPDASDESNCLGHCREGYFKCKTINHCIPPHRRCNGVRNCQDGSDEVNCPGRPSTICPEGDFACRNGDCISASYRCDLVPDCPDRSDEEDCPAQMCLPGQRKCRDQRGCYYLNQTCDRREDCEDGSDEFDCDCSSDEYTCRNGACISKYSRCDGIRDCEDGDDEHDCNQECSPSQFRCQDGTCISSELVCDSVRHCHHGDDEQNCRTEPEMPKCLETEFRCRDNKCILLEYRCDNLDDCKDRSDEEDCEDYCGPKDHRCDGNSTCIKMSKVCDNIVDCKDGSDEENCFPECSWTQYKCDSGECIPNVDRCNGRFDCRDNSDEYDCPNSVDCSSFQFKCSSGDHCVHKSLQCDGRKDCRDGSDEWGCPPRRNDSSDGRCGPNEFKCLNGYCISRSKYCDGNGDCSDWSDEENCNSAPSLDLKTYPPEQTIIESREVVFQCRDEGPGHIPVRWTREGLPLPPNSRDHRGRLEMPNIQLSHSGTYFCEAQGVPKNSPGAKVPVYLRVEPFTFPTALTPVCRPDEATCHNRECIPKHKVCDGVHDCGDGSDESRCSLWGCEPNEFACDNKKCVRKSWICDKDDDCGDGSDERNCGLKAPGSVCFINEFECADRKMCIPKWFHCDSHNDCHDGSDEIGCFPINIIEPSKPMVVVNEGDTMNLTCRATGVPTPVISWRLNWHHVPSKCTSTSENGFGRLTCPDMQKEDQGAYTCEAMDFRNSILAPDSHVIVNPTRPTSCPRGSFNAGTSGYVECIPCFCFGASTDCHSPDNLFLSSIRPAIEVARFVNVRYDAYRQQVEVRRNDQSIIPPQSTRVSLDNVVQIASQFSLARRGSDQTYPYLALPEVLHGNQLKSYNGELHYKLQFGGLQSQFTRTTTPDVILVGSGITLAYNVTKRLAPQTTNDISVKFAPENWRVVEKSNSRNYGSSYATREDIMMALVDVQDILINFQYLEGEYAETTISDIRMDTASHHNTGRGFASSIEQCVCATGYTGPSCEECDDGYMRSKTGLWLGKCEPYIPKECQPGFFGDPSRRIPCKPCPCPLTNAENMFGRSCKLDTDGQPTCDCPAAYDGRRCEVCARGYTGNPLEPSGYCRPQIDECDMAGSYSTQPDRNGQCDCKAHTTGKRCDQCKPDTFALNRRHQHGCIDCFCMGITEECSKSNLYREQIKSVFNSGSHGFTIASNDDYTRAENVSFDSGRWEIIYDNFKPKVYYWVLPNRFLGDKVTSYGGNLKYTLRYVPAPGGASSRNNAPDVEIRSLNNINLVHLSQSAIEPGVESTVTVPILEQYWTREDGGPVDRPHLLMALADLSAIYIKATYTTNTREAGLMSVSLDTADSRNSGSLERAEEVEQCRCPPGYIGTSCEDCDAGYTRTEDGLYLRFCEPCSCNNHSSRCHPETGVCEDCGDNTYGPRCEHCLPGFIRASDNSCRPDGQPCDCDPRGITGPCTGRNCQCKVNVVGARCDRCRDGTFSLMESRPEGCLECYCSGLTSQCQSSNYYREKIPTLVIDDNHGFTMLEMTNTRVSSLSDGEMIRERFNLDYARNEVGYDLARRSNRRLFWSLPSQLTGDKVTSYGGKLSFKLRYTGFRDLIQLEPDTHIILIGNGINLFRHFSDDIIEANYPKLFEVDLIDDGHWKIMNPSSSKPEASRIDMLKTLSNLEKILILGTFGDGIETTHISDVAMDTVVSARSGQQASEVESCRCPPEYKGTSCQQCQDHHYRNYDQTCRRCPCNNNDESCSLTSDNQVRCHCRPGFYGDQCESTDVPTVPPPAEDNKPTITIAISEPTIKIIAVGMTVRYNCSAISRLPGRRVSVSWSREGGYIPRQAIREEGLLIIPEVRETDSGVYICTASDGYGSQSQAITLTVGGSPRRPVVRISQELIEARIGDPLDIRCDATGTPTPSISWSKQDGTQISPYSTQYQGILRIDSLRRSDEGYYDCTASNGYGSDTATAEIRLRDRNEDGVLNISPSGFSGLEGDNVFMTCTTTRNNTRVSWSRSNGRSLPHSSRESNGSLMFYGARSTDQGVYICTAYDLTTGRKVTEAQAMVNIGTKRVPPPVVNIDPDKQTVPQGTSAMIRCTTTQTGVSIRWSKREDTIPPHIQIHGGNLRIPSVRVTDRGMYICTAEYESGQLQKYAILEVEPREAPTIELYPRTFQTLVTGSSMLFQCRASGIPPPNVYWSRPNNQSIPHNIQQMPNGVLRMNSVQVSDAGQYICHAENTAGSTTATANIEVHSIPVIRISPRGPVQLQSGQNLKLECNATGYPRPYISWSRHRSSPRGNLYYGAVGVSDDLTDPSYDNAIYEAYNISPEDEGLYLCKAHNDAGITEERVEVIVNDNNVSPPIPDERENENDAHDQYITLMGGESIAITCHLQQSIPTDRGWMEWSRSDSRPLPDGSRQKDGVLYLNSVNKEAEGEYTCMLIDRNSGSVLKQKHTTISVNYPPRITLVPPKQTVKVGENAKIQCKAEGEPPITITWEAVNRPMPTSVSDAQGYLLFQGIKIGDAGRYVCKARNLIAETSAVAEVIVNSDSSYKPIVRAIDRAVTVYEGEKVELQCSADATIQVRWTKESGPSCCDLPHQAMISGNSLLFEYADLEDSGRYICTGTSPSGSSSSDYIDLTVNRARNPTLTIIPSIDVVKVGGNIDLRCQPSGIPNSQLSWTKVGDRLGNNVQVLENVLRISDVTTKNNGIYMCSARTTSGLYEAKYILDVKDDYYDGTSNGDNNIHGGNGNDNDDYDDGNNGDYDTGYDNGDDNDHDGNGNHNNGNGNHNNGNGNHNNGNGNDHDEHNNGYDNGDDYDNANFDYNNGHDNNGYDVDHVNADPHEKSPALDIKMADAGKSMELTCKTDLEPPVQYSWTKLGQDLPANSYANHSTLILSNLTEKDAGLYLCLASNGEVRMENPIIVTVTGLIPSFHQNPISYVTLPMLLDAHLSFDIEITFKPEQPDGLIMYNGQKKEGGDFISFGLKGGRPEFRFEVGSGPAVITTNRPIRLDQWHTVRLTRNKRDGEMTVDGDGPYKGSSPGRYQGLDLDQAMFLGSVPSFELINPMNGFSTGFVGCISELKIGGVVKPISRSPDSSILDWEGIGDCETCKDHQCQNGGACQQARNSRGYNCICPKSFSDQNCTKRGESCFQDACGTGVCVDAERGIRCKCPIDRTGDRCERHQTIRTPQFSSNSYIAYRLLKSQQKMKMTVMFKAADDSDGILLYSSPEDSNNFVSLAIRNKRLEFLYDNGYGLSQVRSDSEISPGEWEVATIGADDSEIYLNFHDHYRNSNTNRQGSQRSVIGPLLYLGGVDPDIRIHPAVGIRRGFTGCVSSIDVHGQSLNMVWSAQEASGISECSVRESASSISCRPNTCKNNGVCSIKDNRVSCTCRPGFSGAYCDKVEDECISSSPCKNGGTCEKNLRGEVQCLCPPGIAGDKCEHRLEGDVSFNGNGYLELASDLMQHDEPSETEVIEIDFTTTSSDGLLLWQANTPHSDPKDDSDFLAVAVVGGDLEVSYELGSGPVRIRVNDGHRVDDGRRHKVVITRTGMDAQVVLDSVHEAIGSSEGILAQLNTVGNIYIGGAPDIDRTTGRKYSRGFSGCIHRLRLPHQGDIDLSMQPLRTLNALPCSNNNDIEEDEGPTRGDITTRKSLFSYLFN